MTDWQIGDEAVCVDAEPRDRTTAGGLDLVVGAIYRVEAVFRGFYSLIPMLGIAGDPWKVGHVGRDADRFRKIVRDKHEACETEFATLLKRSKRRQSA